VSLPLSVLDDFARNGMFPCGQGPADRPGSVVVDVPPGLNNAYPTGRNGRRFLSDEGRRWKAANVPVLARLPKAEPDRHVVIEWTILEFQNERKDGSGLEKLLVDGMVEAGVLADDSLKYVSGEVWRYRPEDGGRGIRVSWHYDPQPPAAKPRKRRKR
jgi:hypothetical protein